METQTKKDIPIKDETTIIEKKTREVTISGRGASSLRELARFAEDLNLQVSYISVGKYPPKFEVTFEPAE